MTPRCLIFLSVRSSKRLSLLKCKRDFTRHCHKKKCCAWAPFCGKSQACFQSFRYNVCPNWPGIVASNRHCQTVEHPVFIREQMERNSQIIVTFIAFLFVWTWAFSCFVLFRFWRVFLKTLLPNHFIIIYYNSTSHFFPVSHADLKSDSGVLTMLCASHNQTDTERRLPDRHFPNGSLWNPGI